MNHVPVARLLLSRWLYRTDHTYQDLADELGITAAAVCYWMADKSRPSQRNAWKLERVTKGEVPASAW